MGSEVVVPAGTTIFDAARVYGITFLRCAISRTKLPSASAGCASWTLASAFTPLPACAKRNPAWSSRHRPKMCSRCPAHAAGTADGRSSHALPAPADDSDCELEHLAAEAGIAAARFPPLPTPRGHDDPPPPSLVDHDACILCERCIRGCSEIRHNFVIARRGKGYQAGIAFDENLPMGESSCVSCGECMVSCPTGALTNKKVVGSELGGEPVAYEELRQLGCFPKCLGHVPEA